ncbi:MAG: cobyric acid synthase [Terriglobia bacterium]|nr:MAG: cobyric acid synthase [Terriglobia bacterium]
MTSTKAIMLLGTASHVGKSLLTAGLGRIFSDEGWRVAPFKAQNMSLNSAATPDGREIGRAQALQAEACRAVPCAEMNPILLKPCSESGSQVVLLGRVWGQVTASDYHQRRVEDLFPAVLASYRKLASRYDLMLLEGAGSPAEINLREHDIVNMRMAHAADAACLLVGDIDRGGVFASLLGTLELLEAEDRARIRGFVINKFRGDQSLLQPGVDMMEQRLAIPCLGVVPFLRDLGLEEEDGVAIEQRLIPGRVWNGTEGSHRARPLRVGVIALPHIANFTDFDALAQEPSVSLAFVEDLKDARRADVLILPGSKQTLDDLSWLHALGLAEAVSAHPGPVIGICGGFQMLGISIEDPSGVESGGQPRSTPGLRLLPVRTIMREEKTVRRVTARSFSGYEIHMGETEYENGAQPFACITREGELAPVSDGAVSEGGRIWGSYVHGLFDDDEFRHAWIDRLRRACGLDPPAEVLPVTAQREARMNRWADHLRSAMALNVIRSWIGKPE